jgi:hypothetical protein
VYANCLFSSSHVLIAIFNSYLQIRFWSHCPTLHFLAWQYNDLSYHCYANLHPNLYLKYSASFFKMSR